MVLVNYEADWCGSSQCMIPLLEDFSKELGGRMKVMRAGVELNGGSAKNYNVNSIPTILFFRSGALVLKQTGVINRSKLKALALSLLQIP